VITVAIPTYNRGAIAAQCVHRVLALDPPPDEVVVVDQSAAVEPELQRLHEAGRIRLIRLDAPSIPHAMNVALLDARGEIVLFLDDDVEPSPALVREHAAAYGDAGVWAVVGQCLQPGESPAPSPPLPSPLPDLEFRFNHDQRREVRNVIAMNLSVRRARALEIGGFDENFVMVAYRFESDFALRLTEAGGRILFEPRARVRHLKIATGGTRAYGDHKRSPSPAHSVGDYYFARFHAPSFPTYALRRLRKNVLTRYHLAHPWFIPSKLIGEWRGMRLALRLTREGRKLISPKSRYSGIAP
jgi:GT2 family glycosyltransferase